ncbi:MAG TPA: hypothetical protein PLO68_20125, partial [Sedimentisphaerales bacterium]|nr:hypothetical protein [Sedimentisphaerales bacterium]
PESPMVKMEMVSIVRRGMGGLGDPGAPFGYQEIEVGGEQASLSHSSVAGFDNGTVEPAGVPVDVEQPHTGGLILAISFGSMVALVAAISAVILWRVRRD